MQEVEEWRKVQECANFIVGSLAQLNQHSSGVVDFKSERAVRLKNKT